MKMRQLIIDVSLLENDMKDFPIPTIPTVLLKGKMIFVGDDVTPAIAAAEWLASRMGMQLKNLNQSNSKSNNRP